MKKRAVYNKAHRINQFISNNIMNLKKQNTLLIKKILNIFYLTITNVKSFYNVYKCTNVFYTMSTSVTCFCIVL